MNAPHLRRFLLTLCALVALCGCAPKTAPVSRMDSVPEAPRWRPGDYWVFSAKTRSPFALAQRMEVASVDGEIVLTGNGDPDQKAVLNKDLSVRESSGSLLRYRVESGQDAYIFFPLTVGESRTFTQSTGTAKGGQKYTNTVLVEGAEEITVPAGTFKAFRIRVEKRNDTGWSGIYRLWYAPAVGYFVRIVDTRENIAVLEKYGHK